MTALGAAGLVAGLAAVSTAATAQRARPARGTSIFHRPVGAGAPIPPGADSTEYRRRSPAEGAGRGALFGAALGVGGTLVMLPLAYDYDRRQIVGMGTGFVVLFGLVWTTGLTVAGGINGARSPGYAHVGRAAPAGGSGGGPGAGPRWSVAPARDGGVAVAARLSFR